MRSQCQLSHAEGLNTRKPNSLNLAVGILWAQTWGPQSGGRRSGEKSWDWPLWAESKQNQSACLCDEESHQGRDGWSQVLVWVWKRGQWTQASGPKSPLDIPESPTKIYKSSLSPGFITSMSKETQYSLAPVPSLCQKGTTDTPKEHSDEIAN